MTELERVDLAIREQLHKWRQAPNKTDEERERKAQLYADGNALQALRAYLERGKLPEGGDYAQNAGDVARGREVLAQVLDDLAARQTARPATPMRVLAGGGGVA